MNEIAPWQEFGIAGCVIGALFAILVWLVRTFLDRMAKLDARHREERKEWRDEANGREDSLRHVVERLADAVHDLKR